jgi:hypothetical protein
MAVYRALASVGGVTVGQIFSADEDHPAVLSGFARPVESSETSEAVLKAVASKSSKRVSKAKAAEVPDGDIEGSGAGETGSSDLGSESTGRERAEET